MVLMKVTSMKMTFKMMTKMMKEKINQRKRKVAKNLVKIKKKNQNASNNDHND